VRSKALNDLRLARLRLARPLRENLPGLLLEAMAACEQIVTDRGRFPELGSGRGQRRFLFTTPHRERDVRRLEAIALVLKAILSVTDLVTLRSGPTRRDGSCNSITNERIQKWTRLSDDRVERALRDLRAAGYLTCHQPRRDYLLDDGARCWRAYPVVRTVTVTCLSRLGISGDRVRYQRDQASKRQREAPEPLVDVRLARERQRLVRGQQLAAKRARLNETDQAALRARQQARLERIYGRRKE
jgi:hypothetical protein